MTEKADVWTLMGLDEGGLPIHLPMAVNRNGDGPVSTSDAAKMMCWCADKDCQITRALLEAYEVGYREGGNSREADYAFALDEAFDVGEVTPDEVVDLIKRIMEQRDLLAQAMWDARKELGFDCDGDDIPGHAIAGMGYEWFARSHVEEAKEVRKDLDECLDEIPDVALDLKAMARIVVSLDASVRQFPGDPQRQGSTRQKREQGRMAGALSCWEALTGTTGDAALALARKMAQEVQ